MPVRPAPFFHKLSHGMRITVRPVFVREQSVPENGQFVFAYFVRIENVGTQSAQLMARRWHIHDDNGEDSEVIGDGVVGHQPLLSPGAVHEYQSFCVLKGPSGYMEGEYFFERDADRFAADIPRFTLVVDDDRA